jgi:hypothetical protein
VSGPGVRAAEPMPRPRSRQRVDGGTEWERVRLSGRGRLSWRTPPARGSSPAHSRPWRTVPAAVVRCPRPAPTAARAWRGYGYGARRDVTDKEAHALRMKKSGISPKASPLGPLPGTLVPTYKRCGAVGCRCARGALHGPYWRHQWREGGRTRRRYVRHNDVEHVRAALAAWREAHPPVSALREHLAVLRRLMRLLGV